MKPLYMPLATLAQIAGVTVDSIRRVMEVEGMNVTHEFNEDELDRVDSGLLLNTFKKDGLNAAWWDVMERCQREDLMFEGAKCDPEETPEFKAWNAAKHEWLQRPSDEKANIMDKAHWAYTHCPQFIYHRLMKKPPLPRKRRTPAAVQAMKAVEDVRAHAGKPPKKYKQDDDKTEAQIKRSAVNRAYYEKRKQAGK